MRTTTCTIHFPDGTHCRASVTAEDAFDRMPVTHSGAVPAMLLKPGGVPPTVLESAMRQLAQERGGHFQLEGHGDYARQDDLVN